VASDAVSKAIREPVIAYPAKPFIAPQASLFVCTRSHMQFYYSINQQVIKPPANRRNFGSYLSNRWSSPDFRPPRSETALRFHCIQVIELLWIQAVVGEKPTLTTTIAGQNPFGLQHTAERESRKAAPQS